MTQKAQVLRCVRNHPNLSATQVARKLNLLPSSVSSLLLRMLKDGEVTRRRNNPLRGPRGGFVYRMTNL